MSWNKTPTHHKIQVVGYSDKNTPQNKLTQVAKYMFMCLLCATVYKYKRNYVMFKYKAPSTQVENVQCEKNEACL